MGLFSAGLTLMILVFSEIIPKTLGAVYAPALTGFVGHSLHHLTRLMAPALVVSRGLTRLFARRRPEPVSRGDRQAAAELRHRRLARLQQKREQALGSPAATPPRGERRR